MTSSDAQNTILAQGGYRLLEGQRKQLERAGIRGEVICPPGVDPGK